MFSSSFDMDELGFAFVFTQTLNLLAFYEKRKAKKASKNAEKQQRDGVSDDAAADANNNYTISASHICDSISQQSQVSTYLQWISLECAPFPLPQVN